MNDTINNIDFEDSISFCLLKIAKQFPKRPALSAEGSTYSYEELFSFAEGIATRIRHYPDSRCVILAGRNVVAYLALLGALLAGKAYVFLNEKENLTRLKSTFSKIDSTLIIVDSEHQDLAKKLSPSLKVLEVNAKKPFLVQAPHAPPDRVYRFAYLMFTSGSTGEPKGIAISHQNLLGYLKNIMHRARPSFQDRISQMSELTFDFSIHDIFLAWCSGACLCVLPDRKILGFSKFLIEERISFLAAVPSTIRLLNQLNRQNQSFPRVRYTAFCGEILTDEVARQWHRYAPNTLIDNLYGPTEATVAISAFRWSPLYKGNQVCIGNAWEDQEILLLNKEGSLARPGEIGEIYLIGSQVASGYWQSQQLSEEKFFPVYSIRHQKKVLAYRTGDLAQYDAADQLHYKGRCDDQLKLRGYRIEKIEIEEAIQKIAQTELSAIVSKKCNQSGNVNDLTCFISKSPLKPEEIIRRCRRELPDYMIPNRIISLQKFPYNKNGKLDYQKLQHLSILERGC